MIDEAPEAVAFRVPKHSTNAVDAPLDFMVQSMPIVVAFDAPEHSKSSFDARSFAARRVDAPDSSISAFVTCPEMSTTDAPLNSKSMSSAPNSALMFDAPEASIEAFFTPAEISIAEADFASNFSSLHDIVGFTMTRAADDVEISLIIVLYGT